MLGDARLACLADDVCCGKQLKTQGDNESASQFFKRVVLEIYSEIYSKIYSESLSRAGDATGSDGFELSVSLEIDVRSGRREIKAKKP